MNMTKHPWTPWHQVVTLRDDIRSGELSLAIFAADLYEVMIGRAKPIYQDPDQFFALTYPTYSLRELAKEVITRLAGQSEKAVQQLELTYGGGKTHTLITLYHLTRYPQNLPNLPAVQEFTHHIGCTPPPTRIAVLAFDKLDVEKGTAVRSPNGEIRWLKNPWSVLAYQLAGSEGIKLLNADGQDAERDTAPAENLLTDLLAIPTRQGLSVLVLIDEVLMYAREKIGQDPVWRGRLINFFQYLTQAITKVDRCAVVASLLATDLNKNDTLGKEITQELSAIFRREREKGVEPIDKGDVAEVLRRRFFTPESIRDREAFRPYAVAALRGISNLDDQTRKEGKSAEDRLLRSYPFHPDLSEIFYSKWTQLEGFQRTRGVLRTFALALRAAEEWDSSPLISTNIFLSPPGDTNPSEAARELSTVATIEDYEGKTQDWTRILDGELQKAREVQQELGCVQHREIEQAVVATFLHSQPIGHKATTRELMQLLGHTRPNKIDLEKALCRWAETSWFLDEESTNETATSSPLPKSWRLGSRPNLRQMHHEACTQIQSDLIEAKLLEEIRKLKSLTEKAHVAGAKVHTLPKHPKDIEDDGEFHYGILGPTAASDSGKPSAEARKFIEETTGPERPRASNRNVIVLAVPSRDGMEAAQKQIRSYLAWEEIYGQMQQQKLQESDPLRWDILVKYRAEARNDISGLVKQAYCIVVTVSDSSQVQAFKLAVGDAPLFTQIKSDNRSRIQDTAVTAEALLPGGAYDLWRENEPARLVKDLVGAFASNPQLPKMLSRSAIQDTLLNGCQEGTFVLRLTRPDRSTKTYWREKPDDTLLKEPGLEAVLPREAKLSDIPKALLLPDNLPELWTDSTLTFGALCRYFSGEHIVQVQREGYQEPLEVPQVERPTLEAAIRQLVQDGKLWLTTDSASLLAEAVPAGLLDDLATLQTPPPPIPHQDLLPSTLPTAWAGEITTAEAIAQALATQTSQPLPWATVREAIDAALRERRLEKTLDSGPWPCDHLGSQAVKLKVPKVPNQSGGSPISSPPVAEDLGQYQPHLKRAVATLTTGQIQDLADQIGDIVKAAVGIDLQFKLQIQLDNSEHVPPEKLVELNALLQHVSTDLELR